MVHPELNFPNDAQQSKATTCNVQFFTLHSSVTAEHCDSLTPARTFNLSCQYDRASTAATLSLGVADQACLLRANRCSILMKAGVLASISASPICFPGTAIKRAPPPPSVLTVLANRRSCRLCESHKHDQTGSHARRNLGCLFGLDDKGVRRHGQGQDPKAQPIAGCGAESLLDLDRMQVSSHAAQQRLLQAGYGGGLHMIHTRGIDSPLLSG